MYWKLALVICIVGMSQQVFSQNVNHTSIGTAVNLEQGIYDKLLVKGEGTYHNNPNAADLHVGLGIKYGGTAGSVSRLALQPYGHTGGPWLFISRDDPGSAYLDLNYGASNMLFTIHHLGNVGIGTLSPKEKLSVNGNIRAHEIKVETANWPDFVFSKSYCLPSLSQTEQYIAEKGHLPGIPSAKQVNENGVELGEMNAKLLQKIEELTLHMIALAKKTEQQEVLNRQYQQEIKALKAKVFKPKK